MTSNREALLDAAVRCLRERGHANISARDLVAASGTNLGAIGYHFGSKEALINEAITETVRAWIESFGELVRRQVSEGHGLQPLLDELLATTRTQTPLVAAFLDALARAGHADHLREQLASHYERFRADLWEAFRPLFHEQATTGSRRAISSVLLAVADGLIIQCLLEPADLPSGAELLRALSTVARLAEPPGT